MLMIRFQRIGRKNDPAFRMVVLEKASGPKAGKYVDLVGTYNPKTKAMTVQADRIKEWVRKGAQISPSLANLLISKGALEGAKSSSVVSKKNLEKNVAKKKAEEEAATAKAAEEAASAAAAAAAAEAAPEAAPVEEAPAPEAAPVEDVPAPVEEAPAEAPAEVAPEAPVEEVTAPEAAPEEGPAA